MTFVRLFRHGPLLFWALAFTALGGVTVAALAAGTSSPTSVQSYQSAAQRLASVEGWRASLAQMPVAIADGSHAPFANDLAQVAREASERVDDPALVAAWTSAAAAADTLAAVEPGDADALYAGLHAISLAGDRLAIVASGAPWTPAPPPSAVPVGPLPNLAPGVPGPAGPGIAVLGDATSAQSPAGD